MNNLRYASAGRYAAASGDHAEDALRRSEARYRALVEATGQAVWSWTCATDAGDVKQAQDWWEDLTGQTPEEQHVAGAGWLDVVHPDDRLSAKSAWTTALATGEPCCTEFRVKSRRTGWRRIRARAVPIRDADASVREWVGTLDDVTESTAPAEDAAAAERKKRLYETALSSTPDLVYVFDRDHRFTYANEALLKIWGRTWDDAIGRTCLELGYEPHHAAMHDREIDQVIATKQPIQGEVPFNGTNGRRIYDYIFVPVIGADGEVEAVAGTTRDVTDRNQAEKDLRKQTERMRLLWEAASVLLTTEEPDAMMRALFGKVAPHFGLDAFFNFMVNDAGDALRLESCLGIPGETVRTIQRLEFGQAICGTVAQRLAPITATRIQQSDDPKVQLVKGFGIRTYSCNPLLAGDRLLGTLSFASRTRDEFDPDEVEFLRTISRYVTAAYERLWLVKELRRSDRKKDDFIALLAHELRNPLAPIRNSLQTLRMSNDGSVRANSQSVMERQLSHMVRLIDDLLDISRINRNKMDLRRERVRLSEVLNSALETARPVIDAGDHDLTLSQPDQSVYLDADLTRLAQVFSNLLTNSAKYTHRGGKIRLHAEQHGFEVVVTVRDDGIGIPADSLVHIFDMFSQVDRSIERTTGGLGIGLALVKGLVQMHGGSVVAKSDGLGQGSTFTVTLPTLTSNAPAASAEPPLHGALTPNSARRILVVDDNHDGAESLAMLLQLVGDEVKTAPDGVEALTQAEAFRPDVVLMDVGMPRLNGLEATRKLREKPWGRDATIIAVTGWGQESDKQRSRAAGCDGHLVKPINLDDLEKLLRELRPSHVGRRPRVAD